MNFSIPADSAYSGDTVVGGFIRGWPITAAIGTALMAVVTVLARWLFGRIVDSVERNAVETQKLREEVARLNAKLSRLEGYIEAGR